MTEIIPISQEEQKQYRSFLYKWKVDAMTLYLLGDNGVYYNMEEVAEKIIGPKGWDSRTVSMIHRANGINCGKGSSLKGLYRPGCQFEKNYGYRVTRRDIEDFVREFEPMGSACHGVAFEDWLIRRAGGRHQLGGYEPPEKDSFQDDDTWGAWDSAPVADDLRGYEPPKKDRGGASAGDGMAVGIVVVVAVVLIFVFRKPIGAFITGLFEMLLSIGIPVGIGYLIYKAVRK